MAERTKNGVRRLPIGLVLAAAIIAIVAAVGAASRAEVGRPTANPHVSGMEFALATRMTALANGSVGTIEIPRLEIEAPIVDGIDERVMDRAVGRILRTAYPGEPGNVGLAAHRTTHFRELGRVVPGDRIRVRTPDGLFHYRVDTAFVVRPNRTDVLRGDGRARLTLITCFPFDFRGAAPMRFVVQASAIGTEFSTTSRKDQLLAAVL